MNMKRTTIHLDEQDRTSVKVIQTWYGLPSASSAIRMALQVLSTAKNLENVPVRPRKGKLTK